MRCSTMTSLGAVARGLVAGAVGTAVMDLAQFRRYRRGGGESAFRDWEFAPSAPTWEQAPTPAKVGRRLYEGFLRRDLPAHCSAAANNVVHWGYGTGWGVGYGTLVGSLRAPSTVFGLPFGAAVWSISYMVLPLAGLHKPPWQYDAATLMADLGAHLAYGGAAAVAFALLSLL